MSDANRLFLLRMALVIVGLTLTVVWPSGESRTI